MFRPSTGIHLPTFGIPAYLLLPIAFLAVVLSGCIGGPAPLPRDDHHPSSAVYLSNASQEVTLPARAGPCVTICQNGYSHKVADVEDTTLLRLDGVIEWEPSAPLCDKLVVEVRLLPVPSGIGLVYMASGVSPLEFSIDNLTIPMMREGVFLRVVVANEHYETEAGRFYASQEIQYRLQTTAWLRDHHAADIWPELSAEEPLVAGPTSRCGS